MIGVGSYGRVYRGRWRSRHVAVKRILHSASEAAKMARESALSLALKHPNVSLCDVCVRAHAYVWDCVFGSVSP